MKCGSRDSGAYREVGSTSNVTDYPARRLGIRAGKVGGEKSFVHTLNATLVATNRAMVAFLEDFQQADGSVAVPKVLRPYMGGVERIGLPRPTRSKRTGEQKSQEMRVVPKPKGRRRRPK